MNVVESLVVLVLVLVVVDDNDVDNVDVDNVDVVVDVEEIDPARTAETYNGKTDEKL